MCSLVYWMHNLDSLFDRLCRDVMCCTVVVLCWRFKSMSSCFCNAVEYMKIIEELEMNIEVGFIEDNQLTVKDFENQFFTFFFNYSLRWSNTSNTLLQLATQQCCMKVEKKCCPYYLAFTCMDFSVYLTSMWDN